MWRKSERIDRPLQPDSPFFSALPILYPLVVCRQLSANLKFCSSHLPNLVGIVPILTVFVLAQYSIVFCVHSFIRKFHHTTYYNIVFLSFALFVKIHYKMRMRPMIRSDLPKVISIVNKAFANDELVRWLFPQMDAYPDDVRRYQVIRMRIRFSDPDSHGFVAVLEEGDEEWTGEEEVVGFAFYTRPTRKEKQWTFEQGFQRE